LLKRPEATAESSHGRRPLLRGPKNISMSEYVNKIEAAPGDISLLLRAHAELRCLRCEVLPVLLQLETGEDLPEEQYGAAMAYLEVTTLEASRHARESDCAHRELCGRPPAEARSGEDGVDLHRAALRYYEAVRMLRGVLCLRVSAALGGCEPENVCLR
jgi:hypothetical protein